MNSSCFHIFAIVNPQSGFVYFSGNQYSAVKKVYDFFWSSYRAGYEVYDDPKMVKADFMAVYQLVKYDLARSYRDESPTLLGCLADVLKDDFDNLH